MAGSDSDVEFDEEWEEVQQPVPATATAAASSGDITIYLYPEGHAAEKAGAAGKKKRPAARVYTKREREDALMVHRGHSLCLLARALLHDQAAADGELQALLSSMLPLDVLEMASAAATSEDPLARNWLPKLLHWFHRTFSLTTSPAHTAQQQQDTAAAAAAAAAGPSSSSSRRWGQGRDSEVFLQELLGLSGQSVQQQLLLCVQRRRGDATQLAVLLVALLRAVGFLTRSVWSLDALPFKPAAVEALEQGKSIRATTAAATTASNRSAAAAGSSRSKAGTSGKKATPGAAAAADAVTGGRGGSSKRGRGGARGGRGGRAAAGGRGKQQQGCEAAAAAAEGGDDVPVRAAKRRKGDEEFERELAMAMEATAAAEVASRKASLPAPAAANGADRGRSLSGALQAAAAAAAAAAGGGSGSTRPPSGAAAGGRVGAAGGPAAGKQQQESFAKLIAKDASPAALKRAAAAAAAAVPAGWLWQPSQGALTAPQVWAEVYVGGSANGCWLHVDGLLGCYDQPGVVEAAVVRRQPLSYVVAAQEGAPKDVTRRYAANFTVNLKWRDESWWTATMADLRSSAAHLPKQLAAEVANATATTAAATTRRQHQRRQPEQQQQQQQADASQELEAAAVDEQPRKRHKPAQNSSDKPVQPCVSSDEDDVIITDDKVAPAAGGGGEGLSGAALRAAREEAELSARAAQQAAGAPTTVEGFKGHPLYVLERHITKYQAVRPGGVKLGLHKGEAYYAREDVQELHTRERWQREGRQVREDELEQPVKVVKKRSLPAGGGGSGRSRGGGRGGWGPWQRSLSSSSTKTDPDKDTESAPTAPQAAGSTPAAAAAAADGDQGPEKDDNMQRLYGLWQTEAFVRRAEDGKVPKNDRGNIEVPPFAKALPLGTKWIDAPNMAPVCRSLGIDYAPALVGFEVQGGRMVPRIRGVVVCEEHEQAVIELHIKREAERAAAEQQKQRREAVAAWNRLLQYMWTRLELQRKYGPGAAASTAAGTAADVLPGAPGAAAAAIGGGLKDIISGLNATAGGTMIQQRSGPHAAAAGGERGAALAAVPGAAEDVGAGVGQQAARAGGGKAAAGRHSKELPPGVAAPLQEPADQAGTAAGSLATAGGVATVTAAAEPQQQPGSMEGVVVEEF